LLTQIGCCNGGPTLALLLAKSFGQQQRGVRHARPTVALTTYQAEPDATLQVIAVALKYFQALVFLRQPPGPIVNMTFPVVNAVTEQQKFIVVARIVTIDFYLAWLHGVAIIRHFFSLLW
jgi:hypothetical protein